jgi:glycine/D-amino acid oxidase-like deaminating enzyme
MCRWLDILAFAVASSSDADPARPFWLPTASGLALRTAPALPARADVVVVGGGLAGASTAYWLARLGRSPLVLERRGIAGGATGRNGGHIAPGTAERFALARARHGEPGARAIWDFSHRCAEAVRALVAEHRIDCELRVTGSVSLALSPDELAPVRDTAETLAALGAPVEYWDAAACAARTGSDRFLGGVLRRSAGQLWPARLTLGIVEQAVRLGAAVQTGTAVRAVERRHGAFTVRTDRGDVAAGHVVHATNAWARELLPALDGLVVPVRGQVIVTEPGPAMWPFGLSTNHGFEYWLQRPDGRIVLGGMRWLTPTQEVGADDDTVIEPTVSRGLRAFLPGHFPALAGLGVEREWTGIMAFTPDRAPLVGPWPGAPGQHVVLGFNGHGMPMAFLAGRAVAETIARGRPDVSVPDAFRPARLVGSA